MRSNTLDAARRAYLGIVRGRFEQADDTAKMQTVNARHLHNEQFPAAERFQNYGRTSYPRPPDPDGKKAAETLTVFLHGNRAHPIVLAVDDRRFRPLKGNAGDVVDYHYKGNTGSWTDAGWAYNAGPNKLSASWTVGNLTVTWADGKATVQVGGSSGPAVIVTPSEVYLGGDPAKGGTFSPVQTVAGPSTVVQVKI